MGTAFDRCVATAAFATLAALAGYRVVDRISSNAGLGGRALLATGYELLITAVLVVVTLAAVRRPEPSERAAHPLAYLATATAVGSLYFVAAPPATSPLSVIIVGEGIALVAALWTLASVIALGRCFGLLPEARGLVVRGPYRLVRHPIYLGEMGALTGLVIAAPSLVNAIVLTAFVAAQVIRMRFEEEALVRRFPEYAAYAAGRGRLIPRGRRMRSPGRVLRGNVF
jgi:protein-S-isoprenylcysteine O-methyltransferase Ste14